eukprot:358513-Chlamydomonas_euryale.AAC.1
MHTLSCHTTLTVAEVHSCRHLAGQPLSENSQFPDCVCDETLTNSPYRVALANFTDTPQGGLYCFEFKVWAAATGLAGMSLQQKSPNATPLLWAPLCLALLWAPVL